jgi:hypothetical protein
LSRPLQSLSRLLSHLRLQTLSQFLLLPQSQSLNHSLRPSHSQPQNLHLNLRLRQNLLLSLLQSHNLSPSLLQSQLQNLSLHLLSHPQKSHYHPQKSHHHR